MNVNPRRPLFNRKPQSNIYRMFLWVVMILGGVWMLQQVDKGNIKPLFQSTPVPTRSIQSYLLEGDADFKAGKLDAAILSYQEALELNPNDAETWWKLARIRTYSSAFLITNEEKKTRLQEALDAADKAVALTPEDSTAHAIRALALDWNANSNFYSSKEVQDFLAQADQEALIAQQKDPGNTLALAYYAEILIDEQKWNVAELIIKQALERPDASQWMDVYRVNAYVLETLGQYNLAIAEYEKAVAIEPNFTFLYLRIGANYRQLAFEAQSQKGEAAARPIYEQSLEYFAKAAKINEQINVKDPTPYLSISRTYSQLGDFFAAALNVKKALSFEPTNADIYGQLGIVYYRSRNYEGSVYSLKCATYGCSGEESCQGRGLERCFPDLGENPVEVKGQAIAPSTIVYYYTYGSALAGLSRPKKNMCADALKALGEVRAELNARPEAYADGRETILKIIDDGEFICKSLGETPPPDLSTPTVAGSEVGGGTAVITDTPTP
ncbi:MAG TPA: tetratricopeptide repeat protein [Anaerolineales bacterium]|nr:tetratricopeptide repeat protein [Anaerolineales bacterium]